MNLVTEAKKIAPTVLSEHIIDRYKTLVGDAQRINEELEDISLEFDVIARYYDAEITFKEFVEGYDANS